MSIKLKVSAALEKIGFSNGHAAPATQDPIVAQIHEYNVATIGESHFKARREKAKKQLEKSMSDVHRASIDKAIVGVKKNQIGDTVEVLTTDPYTLQIELKNGASFVDMGALKLELMKTHKMDALVVEALIEKCTDRRDPSQSWKVVER